MGQLPLPAMALLLLPLLLLLLLLLLGALAPVRTLATRSPTERAMERA